MYRLEANIHCQINQITVCIVLRKPYIQSNRANADKILGVSPNATQQQIREAYKRSAHVRYSMTFFSLILLRCLQGISKVAS